MGVSRRGGKSKKKGTKASPKHNGTKGEGLATVLVLLEVRLRLFSQHKKRKKREGLIGKKRGGWKCRGQKTKDIWPFRTSRRSHLFNKERRMNEKCPARISVGAERAQSKRCRASADLRLSTQLRSLLAARLKEGRRGETEERRKKKGKDRGESSGLGAKQDQAKNLMYHEHSTPERGTQKKRKGKDQKFTRGGEKKQEKPWTRSKKEKVLAMSRRSAPEGQPTKYPEGGKKISLWKGKENKPDQGTIGGGKQFRAGFINLYSNCGTLP